MHSGRLTNVNADTRGVSILQFAASVLSATTVTEWKQQCNNNDLSGNRDGVGEQGKKTVGVQVQLGVCANPSMLDDATDRRYYALAASVYSIIHDIIIIIIILHTLIRY